MLKGLDIFFYCSYKRSSRGYVFTKADIENGQTICIGGENRSLLPTAVKKVFSNGGTDMVVGKYGADGKYYIVVKGIENVNEELGVDELGRAVYVNAAFVSDSKETIFKLAQYIIMNYNEWSAEISLLVLPSPNDEAGYKIDCQGISDMLDFIDKDLSVYENKRLHKYVDMIKAFETDYSFVVLSLGREYFLSMFNLEEESVPENICIDKKAFIKYTKETTVKKANKPSKSAASPVCNEEDDASDTTEADVGLDREKQTKPENERTGHQIKGGSPAPKDNKQLQDVKRKASEYEKRMKNAEAKVRRLEEKIKKLYLRVLFGSGAALVIFVILLIKSCGKQ